MAQLGTRFDPTAHDTEQQGYELLPTGIYRLEVSASTIKEEDQNRTLALTYDVIEPVQYAKRKVFAYIDLEHSESKKQEDGQREFARLCRAVNISEIEDTDEMHFIPFVALMEASPAGVSKAGRPYKEKNRIKKFFFPTDIAGNPIDVPEPAVDAVQPAARAEPVARVQAPANDNRAAQRPAAAAATGGGSRPWGPKR